MNIYVKALLLMGGGFVIYTGLRFLAIQKMTFGISNVDLSQSALTTTGTITVSIQNPTTWMTTVDRFNGTAYINDKPVGLVTLPQPTTIIEQATTQIPVKVALDDILVAGSILGYFTTGMNNAVFRLKGDATINSIPFPVDLTYTLV